MPPDKVSSRPVVSSLTDCPPLDVLPPYRLMALWARIQPETVMSPPGWLSLPMFTVDPKPGASMA